MGTELKADSRIYHVTLCPNESCTASSLRRELRRLLKAFNGLRKLAAWKAVRGSFYRAEATYRVATDLWHPHIHVAVDASSLDAEALRDDWERLADSRDVDVRHKGDADAVSELLWYVAEPPQLEKLKGAALYDFNRLTNGMHLKALTNGWKVNGPINRRRGKAETERDDLTEADRAVERMRDQR